MEIWKFKHPVSFDKQFKNVSQSMLHRCYVMMRKSGPVTQLQLNQKFNIRVNNLFPVFKLKDASTTPYGRDITQNHGTLQHATVIDTFQTKNKTSIWQVLAAWYIQRSKFGNRYQEAINYNTNFLPKNASIFRREKQNHISIPKMEKKPNNTTKEFLLLTREWWILNFVL